VKTVTLVTVSISCEVLACALNHSQSKVHCVCVQRHGAEVAVTALQFRVRAFWTLLLTRLYEAGLQVAGVSTAELIIKVSGMPIVLQASQFSSFLIG